MTPDPDRYDGLIDTIYKSALGLSDWDNVCRAMREIHPEMGVVIHLHESRSAQNIGVVQDGFDPAGVAPYLSHYAHVSPWLAPIERMAVGAVHHTSDLCPTDKFLKTEFWNDWLRPQGAFAAGSGMVLARGHERHGFVGINYSHQTDRPREEADALLRTIGPHLQRGFSLWHQAAVDRERLTVFENALGVLSLPVLLVDGHRRLRFANDAGEALLRRLDGLTVGANREVRAQDREADDRLEAAIAGLARSRRTRAPLVKIPKADWSEPGEGYYVVSAVPVPHQADDLGFGTFSFYDGSLVLLVVLDMNASLRIDPYILSETFDLTRTEAELAASILDCDTIADYAKRKQVSRYTVRNQLCSIMGKTGTHRQADLVRLLARIAITV